MAVETENLFEVAEIELIYKRKTLPGQSYKITCAREAYDLLLKSWDENKIDFIEQAKVILLSRSNHVLGISHISTGGIAGTVVDPKVVFATALKANASGIVLAHNHPSGNLKPSSMDIMMTEKFKEGGNLLEIKILDHLIITKEGFYSFENEMDYSPSG